VVSGGALFVQWALHTSYLRVQDVTIVGAVHETNAQVLRVTGLDAHPTMWGVSISELSHDVRSFPWVEDVHITKHWPHSLSIRLVETKPVAVAFTSSHQLHYVSSSGRDLGSAPSNANYPTLVYLKPKSNTWPFLRAGRSAAYVASRLPVAFSSQVSQITVGADGEVTLRLTTPVSFVIGEATLLHQKFVAIASVIAHATLRSGDVVDVTVPGELAVTSPGGT
jgi:cell division septal protein FtsQ